MPDTPQRIATDTSQKLGIRFGETIKAYLGTGTLEMKQVKYISLVFAGWLRYLMAVDDWGNAFSLSPDPMLDVLCPLLKDIHIGADNEIHEAVKPILSERRIFGVDLYQIGLGSLIEKYFEEMIRKEGAVLYSQKICLRIYVQYGRFVKREKKFWGKGAGK